MTGTTHKVFSEPKYSVLEAAARELNVQLVVDKDIELAEQVFQLGLVTSGTENGRPPKEQVYLQQILKAVQEQNKLPAELQVYLVDKGIS